MKTGKVILIGGSKRAGKTTLSMMLHRRMGFNYLNFDHLEDAIDVGINKSDSWNDGDYFKGFLKQMIGYSLEDAKNYGINTVLDTYMYNPNIINDLSNRNDIEVYFLADLDSNEEELRINLKKYSKSYDWPSYCTDEQFEDNIKDILARNEYLKEECSKYNIELFNTSYGDKRNNNLEVLYRRIVGKEKSDEIYSYEVLIEKIDQKIAELEAEENKKS